MITKTSLAQMPNGRIKVSVVYSQDNVRISRHEVLFASQRPSEYAAAVIRLRELVRIDLLAVQDVVA